jgi:hypothetical protein
VRFESALGRRRRRAHEPDAPEDDPGQQVKHVVGLRVVSFSPEVGLADARADG